ncbi:MAG: hypothetical protein LBP64_04345 [Tannerella sp.]|jgi:hypothetical protein|nr:hypothetical protein [Tannerella sp.]
MAANVEYINESLPKNNQKKTRQVFVVLKYLLKKAEKDSLNKTSALKIFSRALECWQEMLVAEAFPAGFFFTA